ncbi:MAG TPA: cyclic pyranopterin monophosphate synthase MoaC [Micropepsaceae bacterium]|nr:cyclic pyranopterin monophosphate synthase MoaC [Micropepsaceae bacterium]
MSKLTHLDDKGHARMVDVSAKDATNRMAVAEGEVRLLPQVIDMIAEGTLPKGDALAVARLAGIMGAKRTSDLIPLCHPLAIAGASVELSPERDEGRIVIRATVKTNGPTGVEMEALTAVSVAALALYDMVKAVQRDAIIGAIRLIEKHGGKSGDYVADGAAPAKPAAPQRRSAGFRQAPSSTVHAGARTAGRARNAVAPEPALRPRADAGDKDRAAFRAFMERNRLRVTQWCREAGIEPGLLYGYLHGRTGRLSRDAETRLARVVKVSVDDMFAAP